ncbi:3-isopropylmalate dehydratase small subunit [Methylobacterium sp. ID0610]|uniref:3-isopropylmalate dehydratase small subunit n=1 Tax=Methylobacterium carpenticola TaxID=3344827 RepID=UPI0036B846BA
MEPFTRLDAVAVPMTGADIDTDQILPARFMHKPRVDYGRYCFHDVRFAPDGTPRPGFVLNRLDHPAPRIIVADRNFGCGSSREQAVYTLADFGIRCIVAPSFGDIFQTNCLKNGVLPVVLPEAETAAIRALLEDASAPRLVVDLVAEVLTDPSGCRHAFVTDPFARECLLKGLDEIDYTLTLIEHVRTYEAASRREGEISGTFRHPEAEELR